MAALSLMAARELFVAVRLRDDFDEVGVERSGIAVDVGSWPLLYTTEERRAWGRALRHHRTQVRVCDCRIYSKRGWQCPSGCPTFSDE